MSKQLENTRNIGIIAHIDAGKTTVTERMLFYSGTKHRVGEVDKGTTTTDDDPEEGERGITIYSACVALRWKEMAINLIDTPGHVDFTAEVERSLRVLDGGVVVFSAREGVEAQSETVWRQADRYDVPRVAFINKLDREGADFEATLEQIEKRLHGNPIALQIPVGQGPAHVADPFRGIIDLIEMKMLTFGAKDDRDVIPEPIPADLANRAAQWREKMLNGLYDYSNELLELALQEEPLPVDLIRRVVRQATVGRQIQPILCGSALHGIGVQPVLDAVTYYLPSPLDKPPVVGINPRKKDAKEQRKPSPDEPFCGLVFKILPFKTGDLYWVRVYSGQLKSNSRVYNVGKDKKENVAQIWRIHASKREEQLTEAGTGDIVGVIGPRDSVTGDTLCETQHPILLESIKFPETVISMAIEPESSTERKKLSEALTMLRKQDPTFQAEENEETGQTVISGMGELHLEVISHRLTRDFNVKVKIRDPRVSYRETIAKAVEVDGECHRLIAGAQHTAKVRIRMEPVEGDKLAPIITSQPGTPLAGEPMQTVLEGLNEQAGGGGSLGYPLLNIKVTVIGGELHETETSEIALRVAAADAFNNGLQAGGIVLLEPIMKLEITTPEEHLGDFVSDLQQRRATIQHTENRGAIIAVDAQAPLANLFGYSSAMRSLSQGRGSCSMEPHSYAAAPPEVLKKFT